MKTNLIVWCFSFTSVILTVEASREDEGYPSGFMSTCPDTVKPISIPQSQLQHLYFVVQGRGRSRRKYTYWTAGSIATDPRIDFRRKTVLIAIGYLDSTSFPISTMFANEYEDQNYNVILIDNQRFATVLYYVAARLMRPVGRHVAEILFKLTKSGLDPSKLELLGFSLGGQTISYIAKNFQQLTGKNISRITALEPAGPCFRTLGADDRLDASNGDFVQVIHTNIDGYGMATRMGHVDFYVNGGEFQPGDITILPCTSTCSHFRVLALWISALRHPKKFIGLKCDTIQEARDALCYDRVPLVTNFMGNYVDVKKHGVFYVATSFSYPFYLGRKGLREQMFWENFALSDNDTELFYER